MNGNTSLNKIDIKMETIEINLINNKKFRASEIVADLKSISETLYFPLKMVGFWDSHLNIHLCPQLERREKCNHELNQNNPEYISYEETIQRDKKAVLCVYFLHAKIKIYLR